VIKIGKKTQMEAGYLFMPYIIKTSTSIYSPYQPLHKNYSRKLKIYKIFNIIEPDFLPRKILKNRYSSKTVNAKFYGTI